MRWPAKQRGSRRTRKKFAWLPTRIGDEVVWLEFYKQTLELRLIDGKYLWVELK